jgi:hypothetical protein
MTERQFSRSHFLGAAAAGVAVAGFCLLLLWHDPLLFWNDDYELSILPVFADVARSWSEGHLPLLSPYSWVCSNLAGEFQYGTFSVFVNAAVVAIWKFPLTFAQQAAALSITHLFVLAAGAYLLARNRMMAIPLAMMVAFVAALNGWIICWGATDWFGALGAFAWFPWAWWGLERALDPRAGRYRFVWPAPFVYLLITGGFPYTVLMFAVLATWLSLRTIVETKRLSAVVPLALGTLLGIALSAPAWLALFDYVHGSAREAQDSSAHFQWLLPPAALPAFILPSWTVNWSDFSTRSLPHGATELACGLVPPAALLCGLFQHGRAFVRRMKWELGLLVVVLIISMLPSANVFRWSFRWLPFIHLVLAVCAAEALQGLRLRGRARHSHRLASNIGLTGFALVALAFFAMLIFGTAGEDSFPFTWWILALGALWAVLDWAGPQRLRSWLPPVVTFAGLLITYLCIPPNCGVPKYDLSQQLTRPAPLDPSRLYLSVYPSPEETYRVGKRPDAIGEVLRPGSTSMWAPARLINGYSPIRAAGLAREFRSAIHGEIPPWLGEYLLAWQGGPDGELARLGVDGILVANELGFVPKPEVEWTTAAIRPEGVVYHRRGERLPAVRSFTHLETEALAADGARRPMTLHEFATGTAEFAPATISSVVDNRNQVSADVEVPAGSRAALIGFSRPFFAGYRASSGGQPLAVGSYRGLIPVIELPAGFRGPVVLSYRPWWLIWGGAAAGIAALPLLAGILAAIRSR